MVAQSLWEQERPVLALAVRPSGRHPEWWTRSSESDKQQPCETEEREAGVGAARSTGDAVDNTTTVEGRGRTWFACWMEVSAGECRQG
jgi:hypothetical protein